MKTISKKSNPMDALRAFALRAKSKTHRILFGGAVMALPFLTTSCDYTDYTEQNDKKLNQMERLKTANQASFDAYFTNIHPKTQALYDSLMLSLHDLYLDRDVMGNMSGLFASGSINTKYPSYKEFESRFLQVISNNDLRQNKNADLLILLQELAARDDQIDQLDNAVKKNNMADEKVLLTTLIILIAFIGAGIGLAINYNGEYEWWDFNLAGTIAIVVVCAGIEIPLIMQCNVPSCVEQKAKSKEIMMEPNSLKLRNDIKTYYPGLAKSIFEIQK
jgi:hypothetical protein